jgi:glycosyltransferase involved in cell wall biosynthesis
MPLVSVVIPTKNSEEFIDRVIVNLLNNHYHDVEIIVVDNFSTDSTRERVLPFVDQFYEIGPERTAQVNYGISKAKGELIYVTGSDMCRDYDFIKECVAKIQDGYDAIYMGVLTDKDVKHFWGRVKALERKCIIGTLVESARFFRKDVWESLGGFNEKTLAMEEDFQNRLDTHGYKTAWIKCREYHLHEDDSLWKIFKKAYYYGKHIKFEPKRHKLNRVSLKPFFKKPTLLIGLIIYKFVQYLGGGLGLCRSKIK